MARHYHVDTTAARLAELRGESETRPLDASELVRASVVAHLRYTAEEREHAAHERAARRESVIEDGAERRAVEGMARAMARYAHRQGEPVTARELARAPSSKHRRLGTFDDAVSLAVGRGWIVAEGEHYRAGKSTPA